MENSSSFKVRLQKLGTSLSNMVMPNIPALIAWGVLTALVIPDGYIPNEQLATMVSPMLKYVIPLMIGFTGGYNVYSHRGGIVGAIAAFGAIAGSDVTMIIGAMVMGPLAAWLMKKFDQNVQPKIRPGFEMLVNNFSAGFIAFGLMILSFYGIGPVVANLTGLVGQGVDVLVKLSLLPLANIIIEPAKILFLNNALNHGIFTPIGTQQVTEAGKSILFLLEANPGPGLGILLAYALFGRGSAKSSSWGAMIIHFLGGIHEIYFPYVMMKPAMFLAVIAGGVSGTFTFQLLGAGLTAPASPGSIIAIMVMSPKGWGPHLVVLAGVLVATLVSFIVGALVLRFDNSEEASLEEAKAASTAAKAQSKGKVIDKISESEEISTDSVKRIIFACDAGMGSSAMGASLLRNKIKKAGLDNIPVTNQAISTLDDTDYTLIVTQEELADRAKQRTPRAIHVAVDNFLTSPKYDDIVSQLLNKEQNNVKLKSEDNNSESPNVDLDNIDEVVFAYGVNQGSATMGCETLKTIFRVNNINIPVITVSNANLSDHSSPNILIVTTIPNQTEVQAIAPNSQLLVVDSLVTTPEYDKIVARMNK